MLLFLNIYLSSKLIFFIKKEREYIENIFKGVLMRNGRVFKTLISMSTLFFLNSAYLSAADLTKEQIEHLTQTYKDKWYDRAIEVYNAKHPENPWVHPYFSYTFPDDADFEAGNPPDEPMTSYEWMENAGVGFTKKISIPSGPYSYSKELVQEWKKQGFRAGRFHIAPTEFRDLNDTTGYKLDESRLKVLKDACQLFIDEGMPVVISTGSYGYNYTNFNADWEDSFNHVIDWWRQIAEYFKDTSYLLAFENFIEYHGFDRVDIERKFRERVDNNESRYPEFNHHRRDVDNYVREPAYNNLNAEIAKVFRVTNPKRVFIYKPRGVGRNNIGAITPWRWGSEIDPYPNHRTQEYYWLISTGGGANTRISYIQALRENNETIKKKLISDAAYKSWGNIVTYHNVTQLPVWVSLMGIKTDQDVVDKSLGGVPPTTEEMVEYLNWYLTSIQTLAYNPETMKRDRVPNGFQQSWWLWHFGIENPTWNETTIYDWRVADIRDTLGSYSFGGDLTPKYFPPAFLKRDEVITREGAFVGGEFNSTLFYEALSDKEDHITFTKVSGPDWLQVLPDGTIKGTPTVDDVGENSFVVAVVGAKGDQETKELKIDVQRYEQITFNAIDDTLCDKAKPETNFGDKSYETLRRVRLNRGTLAYFKFDVATNKEIRNANLQLYVNGVNTSLNVYLLKDNEWDEETLNWENRPTDIEKLATIALTNKRGEYVDINLTNIVTENTTYSFVAESTKKNERIYFKESLNKEPLLLVDAE